MASKESYRHTVDEVISKSCSWRMSLCMTIRMVLKATRVEEAEVGENSSNCDEAQNEESCRRKRKKKEVERVPLAAKGRRWKNNHIYNCWNTIYLRSLRTLLFAGT